MKITKAQKEALEVVMKLTDSDDPNKREYILTLICGILNIELEDESITPKITDITLPINPNNGNDKIHINIPDWPDWVKPTPISPVTPGDYQPPQVWYNHEPEPIQTKTPEDVRYTTEVTYTGDKNCITTTRNSNDCITYTGDFRDGQTSFNDK